MRNQRSDSIMWMRSVLTAAIILCWTPCDGLSGSSNDFTRSLHHRFQQANKIPLVFRETLLPRQRLSITIKNGLMLDLIQHRLQGEMPTFGLLGVQQSGELMTRGVEVEIISHSMNKWKTGIRIDLQAGRRFQIIDQIEESTDGWCQAAFQYLTSEQQEAREHHQDIVEAKVLADQFTDPHNHMVNLWIELARKQERFPGQIDALLRDLGEIPEGPSEKAFWVGALINPTPKIHLAFEIRQRLLTAPTAKERVRIALDALLFSIRRMDPDSYKTLVDSNILIPTNKINR